MPERRVLVTGGTGYIGTVLAPLLASRGVPVRVYCSMAFGNAIAGCPGVEFVTADIRDAGALRHAMDGVTDVVHLAGIVTDELVDMNPALAARVNEDGTRALCQAARRAGVERLVYASSSSVYGSQDDVCTEGTPPRPQTAYARMKLAGERIVNEEAGGMAVCSVRSATCCGPAPRMRLDTIVNVFSAQAFFDGRVKVHGGDQHRSNVHVRDAAELYAWLLDQPRDATHLQAFNCVRSWAKASEIALLVQTEVFRATGHPVGVDVDETKRDARHYRIASVRLPALGWTPRSSIEEAVWDNVRWFQSGGVKDWKDDVFYNTRRMAAAMKGA